MNPPKDQPKGQPIAIDALAKSKSATEPAFLAPPEGSPVYYGFPILGDVAVDGFILGKISDFEAEPCEEGDAFLVAPDGSRAGLVWKISQQAHFFEVLLFEPRRWGVWDVTFPYPMTNRENARRNLEFVLPKLKQKWAEWRRSKAT